MNRSFSTSLKATGLATTLIWVLNVSRSNFNINAVPFVLLTIIPIWIVCYISILTTIYPFRLYNRKNRTDKQLFNRYFPYYSICVFFGCVVACMYSNFDKIIINFFSTVFFTATTSWVWYFKKVKLL